MSTTVQEGVKTWMTWLRRDVGFVGWRYDMVKGYAAWAIELYNRATEPVFSVGEHLDGDPTKVMAWIDSTHPEPVWRSPAFDYPLYFALQDAVANRKYGRLKYGDRSAGICGMWAAKCVETPNNHDMELARNGAYGPAMPTDARLMQAYAYVLTSNGTPSVFWHDIYDSRFEGAIRELIWIRKHYRITSTSQVYIDKAQDGQLYAVYVRGVNGEVAVKLGPAEWSPSGAKWLPANARLLASGDDWAVWGERGRWW